MWRHEEIEKGEGSERKWKGEEKWREVGREGREREREREYKNTYPGLL